jgi:TetR/AcrR family transcriptional repressor of mexJK operon
MTLTDTAPEIEGRTARKRRAILDAATEIFLRNGYLGTNMDEISAQAAVSKQTVYKQFAGKEALFLAIVDRMTRDAGDEVQRDIRDPDTGDDVAAYLLDYADRQLSIVLTPRLMQLRRLVIGEAGRFPELGRALHDGGPGRAIAGLAAVFARWGERGLLAIDDPQVAATHFNWLVMGAAVNRAMLLGDDAIPDADVLHRQAVDGVRAFLAAYRTA